MCLSWIGLNSKWTIELPSCTPPICWIHKCLLFHSLSILTSPRFRDLLFHFVISQCRSILNSENIIRINPPNGSPGFRQLKAYVVYIHTYIGEYIYRKRFGGLAHKSSYLGYLYPNSPSVWERQTNQLLYRKKKRLNVWREFAYV